MKKVLSLLLVIASLLTLCSCGKDKGRILYNVNLEKYVELGEYKDLKIDTSSKEYKDMYEALIEQDIAMNYFYKGTVKEGDTVNIDYVGKKGNVAFEGGTAESQELTIGSNRFIDGFEEGLIGVDVGSVVELNLKFPEDYGVEDLNGADVVFTVKVNYTQDQIKKTPEEFYKDLGFNSVEEYYENIKTTTIETLLLQQVVNNSRIKEFPEKEANLLMENTIAQYETEINNMYGVSLEVYLNYAQKTMAEFEEILYEQEIKPMMESQLAIYAVFDKEKLSFTKEDVESEVKKIVKEMNQANSKSIVSKKKETAKSVKALLGDHYFEDCAINKKVVEFLLKSAKIS